MEKQPNNISFLDLRNQGVNPARTAPLRHAPPHQATSHQPLPAQQPLQQEVAEPAKSRKKDKNASSERITISLTGSQIFQIVFFIIVAAILSSVFTAYFINNQYFIKPAEDSSSTSISG